MQGFIKFPMPRLKLLNDADIGRDFELNVSQELFYFTVSPPLKYGEEIFEYVQYGNVTYTGEALIINDICFDLSDSDEYHIKPSTDSKNTDLF